MPRMAPSTRINLRITDEMHAALLAYCEEHGCDLSELLRAAALEQIGRKDLIDTMPSKGQPRKRAEDA